MWAPGQDIFRGGAGGGRGAPGGGGSEAPFDGGPFWCRPSLPCPALHPALAVPAYYFYNYIEILRLCFLCFRA